MTQDDRLPGETRVGRAALVVEDGERMVDFYREVVGLSVLTDGGQRATLGVDGRALLVLERDETAPSREPTQTGLFHVAFEVGSRAALGACLERIRDRWTLDGASDHSVSEALYLTDPEGNGVELYCDRPREAWPREDDGSIVMGTAPLDLEAVASASAAVPRGPEDGASRVPAETTVGHVHLEVSALEAARAFYVDALGLDVAVEAPSALFLAAGGYHHHLGVNTWNGRTAPAGGRGLAWFELLVPTKTALAAVRRRLEAAGVATSDRSDGFALRDPDGIGLRVALD